MTHFGLFVGLTTLDMIYRVEAPPTANQKIVASDTLLAAGGPATNGAIAFQHFGNRAMILSAVGCHPLSQMIHADVQAWDGAIADLDPQNPSPPPISSILVTETTGDRAVVSMNAVRRQAPVESIPEELTELIRTQTIAIVLIDGHQMAVGRAIALLANEACIPVVIDGGSWKPGFEAVLPLANVVIASANFHPPGCETPEEAIAYLQSLRIPHIAVSRGAEPILFQMGTQTGEIPIPACSVVDTLGAGDILHGAFCHFYLKNTFPEALKRAAAIASRSCQFFGTRGWMRGGDG
ncbi:MAG: sugar kinase [Synechococcales cyanobacterium T60_A2020_003]|nr:sugar kinase [Synechococcales cyanobacterium T60_A2020_003]